MSDQISNKQKGEYRRPKTKPKVVDFNFEPIAHIKSPFRTKYGAPRQAVLAPSVESTIKFKKDSRLTTALQGLDQFTHLWVIFVFDQHGAKDWIPSIRPPRLGGKEKMGVLASRSPHRPNPIGLSAVKIKRLNLQAKGGAEVIITGGDFVDDTPVLDIKPYIPYADIMSDAASGWAQPEIKKYPVSFSKQVDADFKELGWQDDRIADYKTQITEVLCLDPRPAYLKAQFPMESELTFGRNFGIEFGGMEFEYSIERTGFYINGVREAPTE